MHGDLSPQALFHCLRFSCVTLIRARKQTRLDFFGLGAELEFFQTHIRTWSSCEDFEPVDDEVYVWALK